MLAVAARRTRRSWRWWWWRFWTWGKLRHREVRARGLRPRFPSQVPHCQQCPQNCCQGPHQVSLRLVDLSRLVDAGLAWAVTTPRVTSRLQLYREHPELEEAESRDSFRRFGVLKQTAAGRCVFLDTNNRCAIYPIRPLVCQRFPYLLNENLRDVHYASSCPQRRAASREEVAAVLDVLAEHHGHKLLDLALLDLAPDVLQDLGLARFLPRSGARRKSLDPL